MSRLYSGYYSLFTFIWNLFDLFFITYECLGTLHRAFFFIYCTEMAYAVYAGHATELYNRISGILQKKINKKGNVVLKVKDYFAFRDYLREHNLVCYLFTTGGTKLFSSVMWAFIVLNTPINIYLIRRLVFMKQPIIIIVLLWFIITLQIAACCVVMSPLARCCQVLHKPIVWISQFQLITYDNTRKAYYWTLLKLKFNDLFFRLHYGPKYAVCMGPTSPITYMNACEVCDLIILRLQ